MTDLGVDYTRFQRFQIEGPVGRGGIGTVFRAIDTELGARVALKVLRNTSEADAAYLKSEFRIARQVRHPNIVQLHELVEDGGCLVISMEYLEGVEIDEACRQRPHAVTDLLLQLSKGLGALHRCGFIHADIKPENVLVCGGRVVILDFHLSLRQDHVVEGELRGTPAYMSPEALYGSLSTASDLYAIGAILHQVEHGAPPWPAPKTLRKGVLEPVHYDLMQNLLHRSPETRFGLGQVLRCLDPKHVGAIAPEPPPPVLGDMLDAIDALEQGQRVDVEVVGAPGAGKSSLLRNYLATRPDAWTVMVVASNAERIPLAFADAIGEALAPLMPKADPETRRWARVAAPMFPSLGDGGDQALGGPDGRWQCIQAIGRILRCLATH